MMETSWDVQVQAVDSQTFGAMVVSKTLDTLNAQSKRQTGSSLYEVHKDVLMPV